MTDREKAIVMAYTGICMLTGDKLQIFYKYVEDIIGRPVYTHEMAIKAIDDEIKEKSKADFIALCADESSSEKPQYTDAEIQKMQDLEFAEIQKAYEIGKAENSNRWIPVSERYPKDGQRILVDYCDEDAGIMLIRFNVNGYHGFKAWMPLPLPWKGE